MKGAEISVIICTHNPRREYLLRALDALDAQTLSPDRWSLLIIDNASNPDVPSWLDVDRKVRPYLVREETLGLTAARLRAIRETQAPHLLFVDDDNVLAPDYLEQTLAISRQWSQLGVWGGQTFGEFEVEPEGWTRPYWHWIGVRPLATDIWSNILFELKSVPVGAGMCVRREVADVYANLVENDPVRRALGRTGTQLIGSEDSDVAFTAVGLGFGKGVFRQMKLTHLIPKNRVDPGYLLRLIEALSFSGMMLQQAHGVIPFVPSRAQRLLRFYQSFFVGARLRRIERARIRGQAAAVRAFAKQPVRAKSQSAPVRPLRRESSVVPAGTGCSISVILCTHNPRTDYFAATLEGLQKQTLPLDRWEFVVIDNASTPPLKREPRLEWHPNSRVVREDRTGLTHARLRGFREARCDLFVLVDDDNVLAPDFLACALELANQWPMLGAWGGQCHPRWEVKPEDWTRPYWHLLGIRQFEFDRWSNVFGNDQPVPIGAGMVVRRKVAEAYATTLAEQPARAALDRVGGKLTSCGDTDLALTALDLGMGTGQFAALELDHLMPASRIEQSYLERLARGIHYSATVLASFRTVVMPRPSRSERLLKWYESWHIDPRTRRFDAIERAARDEARRDLALYQTPNPLPSA
jgi:glycosyltransferase involved in cell wall biosynthesis